MIGFDDIPLAAFLEPPLTTMHQDPFEIGQAAARLLIGRVEQPGTPVQHVLLPAELVVRGSTAPTADSGRPTADRLAQNQRGDSRPTREFVGQDSIPAGAVGIHQANPRTPRKYAGVQCN